MGERLDTTGLTYFWGKIKSYISGKIVDNLTSTSATDALSANQGKVLNEKFGKQIMQIALTNAASVQFSVPSNSRYLFICTAADVSTHAYVALVSASTSGEIGRIDIVKGSGVSTISTSTANKFGITFSNAANRMYFCVPLNDAGLMTLDT